MWIKYLSTIEKDVFLAEEPFRELGWKWYRNDGSTAKLWGDAWEEVQQTFTIAREGTAIRIEGVLETQNHGNFHYVKVDTYRATVTYYGHKWKPVEP